MKASKPTKYIVSTKILMLNGIIVILAYIIYYGKDI